MDIRKAVTELEYAIKQADEFSKMGNAESSERWIETARSTFAYIEKVTDNGWYIFSRLSALRIMSARFGGEYTERYNNLNKQLTTN